MTYNPGVERLVAPVSTGADAMTARTTPVGEFLWDLIARIGKKNFARAVGRHADAGLETEIVRLADLSPHLLLDIGVDPATGELIEQIDLPRPLVNRPLMLAAPQGEVAVQCA